jgi:hypothetical protein
MYHPMHESAYRKLQFSNMTFETNTYEARYRQATQIPIRISNKGYGIQVYLKKKMGCGKEVSQFGFKQFGISTYKAFDMPDTGVTNE